MGGIDGLSESGVRRILDRFSLSPWGNTYGSFSDMVITNIETNHVYHVRTVLFEKLLIKFQFRQYCLDTLTEKRITKLIPRFVPYDGGYHFRRILVHFSPLNSI